MLIVKVVDGDVDSELQYKTVWALKPVNNGFMQRSAFRVSFD